jgi:hypothetical protein
LTKQGQWDAEPISGGGILFALRAIGLIILARWLYSMSESGFGRTFQQMTLSPWACLHMLYIFLLLVLPGARARAERPFHPLPLWLSRTLRWLAVAGFIVALAAVGAFAAHASLAQLQAAVTASNGWLVIGPVFYLAVIWLCRPRARWRTQMSARHFAIGRYAVSIDSVARLATVWNETHRVGNYAVGDLTLALEPMRGRIRVTLFAGPPGGEQNLLRRRIFKVAAIAATDRDSAHALQAALQSGGIGS